MIVSLCFLALGFLISLFTTPWVIRLSHKGFGLDHPIEARKSHAAPIPRMGGLPVMLAISVGIFIIFLLNPARTADWLPILLGCVLMFGLGLWDDLKPLGARVKLMGQILIASLVFFLGLGVDKVTYPGGTWSVELGWWGSYCSTVFWLIAVPNIINLIDGFDGLAGGLGMFMACTLGIVGILAQQLPVAWFAFTVAGALLGFLIFNFPPARIYLGDGGAYLIGFCIAALSLVSSQKGSVAAVLLVTIVALGVPILDTCFALLRRAVRGFPLFHADDDHFHHKLERLGFSKRRILLGAYGICVILSLIGLSIFWSQGRTLPIAIGAIFLLVAFVLRYVQFYRSWKDVHHRVDRVIKRRGEVQYAILQAQLLEMEVDRCKSAQEFWAIFEVTMRRIGFVDPGEIERNNEVAVHVRFSGTNAWTLHAPRSRGSHSEWQRIAECFRPVYVKAKSRWRE